MPLHEKNARRNAPPNTLLQALLLLNDPTHVEAARALATRIITEKDSDSKQRIIQIYEIVLQRQPNTAELQILKTLNEQQQLRFQNNEQDAEALLSVGESAIPEEIDRVELATSTSLSRVVLNLHETITRN